MDLKILLLILFISHISLSNLAISPYYQPSIDSCKNIFMAHRGYSITSNNNKIWIVLGKDFNTKSLNELVDKIIEKNFELRNNFFSVIIDFKNIHTNNLKELLAIEEYLFFITKKLSNSYLIRVFNQDQQSLIEFLESQSTKMLNFNSKNVINVYSYYEIKNLLDIDPILKRAVDLH